MEPAQQSRLVFVSSLLNDAGNFLIFSNLALALPMDVVYDGGAATSLALVGLVIALKGLSQLCLLMEDLPS